jgi:signal transduction histidine kinase
MVAEPSETEVTLDAKSEQEAAQQLRSLFLASVTHEFRTPLAALNASVEYLLDEFDQMSKEEIRRLIRSIHLSVTGLQTLIDNLLESITIEAGRFVIHARIVELEGIVDEATHVVTPLLDRRFQRLAVMWPPVLPVVVGDATRLTQVLVNLLSNASKYGPIEQTIELHIEDGGDLVRLAVMDRGPGIPSADRDKLFQRFTRLGETDGAQYGIGLGLSVVKVIVEEHGGQVGVDDRPGGGSVFWFTIPTAKEST